MKKLRVVGSGVKGAHHLTDEAKLNLDASKKVLYLGSIEGFDELAKSRNWHAEDISSLYVNGSLDQSNYENILNKVTSDLESYEDVCLVLLGHPRLGVTIVQELQARNENSLFQLNVLPGISSFDTIINDIGYDPLEEGTSILDANRLVLFDYHMDPCINYIIYHVCSIGNAKTDYSNPYERNSVSFLKQKLLKHFQANHDVKLISSDSTLHGSARIYSGNIGDLELLLSKVTFDSSLFIPAVLPTASQINKEFYKHLRASE